jgi:hypothetical protein
MNLGYDIIMPLTDVEKKHWDAVISRIPALLTTDFIVWDNLPEDQLYRVNNYAYSAAKKAREVASYILEKTHRFCIIKQRNLPDSFENGGRTWKNRYLAIPKQGVLSIEVPRSMEPVQPYRYSAWENANTNFDEVVRRIRDHVGSLIVVRENISTTELEPTQDPKQPYRLIPGSDLEKLVKYIFEKTNLKCILRRQQWPPSGPPFKASFERELLRTRFENREASANYDLVCITLRE